uniref:Fe2OG dioxygenase domain-containing protein n=1 Tax=Pyrodinium bahamense TaxID=73915 RepID=A0A7S0A3H6_9DINO|mmetsp:Transcript_20114/g.55402  ORF Transcript_20114/g.55402 Transcript_20114/m.55402 type:complete len:312 (+) Transcript_20114:39-974(+)
MSATCLEHDAERIAQEVATRGLAFLPLPSGILDEAVAIFKHISTDALADQGICMTFEPLETWPPLPRVCRRFVLPYLPVQQLNFFIGDQGDVDEGDHNFLRYANAARRDTLERLGEPIARLLEPATRYLFGARERVITVNAQYIFGTAKSETEAHRDFLSRNTVSLLTPLFDYTPEEASLYYWRFDENPELYVTGDLDKATLRRTYSYKRGEAVLFSGDLYHQTVPFQRPAAGWGTRQCRALFCVVLVAADLLQREEGYQDVIKHLRGPAGGYMVDPATEEFLVASSESGEAESSSECDSEETACDGRGWC